MTTSQHYLRKIAVFTGTRAEYGLLYWLMKEINECDSLQLQLLVSGTHLSKTHGFTIEQIVADGFAIDAEIDIELSEQDARIDVAHSMSLATNGVANALAELQPDVLILLGDRYELLGAASAALIMGVPIFHLHGGEVTEGAYDDSIRHAITKMATWHGVANNEYHDRVVQMGEPAENVFTVGAMGLDNIQRLELLDQEDLEQQLKFRFGEKSALVTFHPVTNAQDPLEGFLELLAILQQQEDLNIIFTHPNADHGRNEIIRQINEFVSQNSHRSIVVESLGQLRFLSAIKYCDVMIGNSSSGIIEAPAMQTPSLNIGDRQKGRFREPTIVDSSNTQVSIQQGLNTAMAMQTSAMDIQSPFTPAQSVLSILNRVTSSSDFKV